MPVLSLTRSLLPMLAPACATRTMRRKARALRAPRTHSRLFFPPELLEHVSNLSTEALQAEFFVLWRRWARRGYCSYHTETTSACHGPRKREELSDLFRKLEKQGLTKRVRNHRQDVNSRQWEFTIPGVERVETWDGMDVERMPSWGCVTVPKNCLEHRNKVWRKLCATKPGWEQYYDVDGDTEWGAGVLDGISNCTMPRQLDLTEYDKWDQPKARKQLCVFLRSLGYSIRGSLACATRPIELRRGAFVIRGRCYHALTSLPKFIRNKCTINNEPVVIADIHGCYYAALASMLSDGPEKRRIQHMLNTRTFYSTLAAACGVPNDGAFKVKVQTHCLFYEMRYDSKLANAFRKMFPQLAALISGLRAQFGVGGLSDKLMDAELNIVTQGAFLEASQLCPCVPIHDGIMCPASYGEQVKALIEKHCLRVLGFMPNVKVA